MTSDDGYQPHPADVGSPYPSGPPAGRPLSQRQLDLRVQYVDQTDPEMAALWRYSGAWGAATLHHYPWKAGVEEISYWGYYLGSRRPALAAWFLWNLFLDDTFGCCSTASLTPPPPGRLRANSLAVSIRVTYGALAMLAANRYVSRPGAVTSYSVTWQAGT